MKDRSCHILENWEIHLVYFLCGTYIKGHVYLFLNTPKYSILVWSNPLKFPLFENKYTYDKKYMLFKRDSKKPIAYYI